MTSYWVWLKDYQSILSGLYYTDDFVRMSPLKTNDCNLKKPTEYNKTLNKDVQILGMFILDKLN